MDNTCETVLKALCLPEFYSSSTKLTNAEVRKKRNAVFEEEKQRQGREFVKRIEKISVEVKLPGRREHLLMNKHISTPYNCAMRKLIFPVI